MIALGLLAGRGVVSNTFGNTFGNTFLSFAVMGSGGLKVHFCRVGGQEGWLVTLLVTLFFLAGVPRGADDDFPRGFLVEPPEAA